MTTGPGPYEGGRRRRRGGGWLWPLLALILLVLAILLLVRACGDDDGDEGAAAGTTTAQSGGAGNEGAVEFDELVAASGGSIAEWAGREVDVDGLDVLTVVDGAGFWVGDGDDRRVFVEVEDETGLDELGLEEGDAVAFTGIVEKNLEAETYGLEGDDARLFREQGAHLRVQAGDVEKA